MTIKVGDKIPSVVLQQKTADGVQPVKTDDLFKGKRVVLFAVPGAFTPTCSAKHLPGFVQNADKIMMLADGSAHFAKALGLDLDLMDKGLGMRSQRYAMVVNDGKVEKLFVEQPGKFEVSSAENVLSQL
jgi:peroxiredoxin (alkyl hydroperoxide reductase subunit C)